MPRILRRPLAGADVDEIWDYIAEDSMVEADAWVDRLDAKLRLLPSQPVMGHSRDEPSPDVRSLRFGRYVISICLFPTKSRYCEGCTRRATSRPSSSGIRLNCEG
jgi:toxin ParE1/3/4